MPEVLRKKLLLLIGWVYSVFVCLFHLLLFRVVYIFDYYAEKIKSFSTNQLWKMYGPQLKKHFWIEHTFWSDGYFVCSTGDASTDNIKKYIESPG